MRKSIKLIPIFISALLTACVTSHHAVNEESLREAVDRTFYIGRVQIPCNSLNQLPWPPFRNDKEYQLTMLNNIPVENVAKLLNEKYGLEIASSDQLSIKSSAMNIIGLVSDSSGRCYYKEKNNYDEKGNIINIFYTINSRIIPALPVNLTTGYELEVKSSGKDLVVHRGIVEDLEFSFFNKTAFDGAPLNLQKSATKITDALRRGLDNENRQ